MSSLSIPPDVLLQHGAFVRALAVRLLADEHLADDVAQDAWLRYLERPPHSAFDPRHWLAIVVRNRARNARRDADRRQEHELRAARPEATRAPDEDAAQASVLRAVVEAVLALDEPYRSTVLARYYRDVEPARIAHESGVPVATVKSRLQRAHAQLRERLDRERGGRANWALALGKLAGLETAATSAVASSVTVVAAACLVAGAIGWWWRSTSKETRAELAVASASAPLGASEPVAPDAARDERRELDAAPPAAPSQWLRVSGTVRDLAYEPLALAGGPAPGVEVKLRLVIESDAGSQTSSTKVTTDADGTFVAALENPQRRPARLLAMTAPTDERRETRVDAELEASVDARSDVELVRVAHGLLEGVVVDTDGAPMPNARLNVWSGFDEASAREVAADERGRVRAPFPGWVRRVDALDGDVTVLSFDAPMPLEGGGSAGLRVVLARSASLSVRVVDGHGRGIEGMRVKAELDESELRQVGAADRWDSWRNDSGATDAEGRVHLDRLWADCKLRITVSSEGEVQVASGARGGELAFDDDSAVPIVLAPGQERELVARWTGELQLVGSTRSRNGEPLGDVAVWVTPDHAGHPDLVAPIARLRSAADGTFATRLRQRELSPRLRIVAAENKSPAIKLEGLGYMGAPGPTDGAVGRLLVETASAVEGTLRADVVLEPTLTIAGRVLDADGQPITRSGLGGCRLWIAPAGTSSHRESGVGLGLPGSTFHPDGTFLFFGLTRGDWDLYVTKEIESFYTWESSVHVFPRTPAGAQGVELRLPREGEVHVRLRLHGATPDDLLVLHGKLFPHDAARAKEPAPAAAHVTGVDGWPVGASFGFSGIGGDVDARGVWSFGFYETDEVAEHALQPMGPGWYVFGIRASSRDGTRAWSPQATTLAWYEPGDYTIDFELVPTTELAGRVLADARAEHLAVELCTRGGERVPLESLPGSARPKYVLETDAHGRFVIRHAPLGAFLLRAGSPAELERGEFRRELPVELAAGANAPIEVTLR